MLIQILTITVKPTNNVNLKTLIMSLRMLDKACPINVSGLVISGTTTAAKAEALEQFFNLNHPKAVLEARLGDLFISYGVLPQTIESYLMGDSSDAV